MPSGGRYVLLALLDGSFGALLLGSAAETLETHLVAWAVGAWALATAATDGLPYLGTQWLRGPGRNLVAAADLRAWVAFYAVVGALAALGAALRSLAAPALLGGALPAGAGLTLAINKVIGSLIVVAAAERHAAFRRDATAREARLETLTSQVQRSRTDVVALADKIRSDLAASLHGEVQGSLLVASFRLGEAAEARAPGESGRLVAEAGRWLDGAGSRRQRLAARAPAPPQPGRHGVRGRGSRHRHPG